MRVLLVGTATTDVHSLLSALERRGSELECVQNAAELRTRAEPAEPVTPRLVYVDLGLTDTASEELVRSLTEKFPNARIVALVSELDGERGARLLALGVPSLCAPVSAETLAELAAGLASERAVLAGGSAERAKDGRSERTRDLSTAFEAYVAERALSEKQRIILRAYLGGRNDKAIAEDCGCSVATVYEHWRRMAKKAGGAQKGDVIADFHRFLDMGS